MAANETAPVYFVVGSAELQRDLAATLEPHSEDRVLLLTDGEDAEWQLFALAGLNHRRMEAGRLPITVRDLREPAH